MILSTWENCQRERIPARSALDLAGSPRGRSPLPGARRSNRPLLNGRRAELPDRCNRPRSHDGRSVRSVRLRADPGKWDVRTRYAKPPRLRGSPEPAGVFRCRRAHLRSSCAPVPRLRRIAKIWSRVSASLACCRGPAGKRANQAQAAPAGIDHGRIHVTLGAHLASMRSLGKHLPNAAGIRANPFFDHVGARCAVQIVLLKPERPRHRHRPPGSRFAPRPAAWPRPARSPL